VRPLLRRIALAEGASLLVLVGIAMPLKHLLHRPLAVRIVGLLHGVLFVAYVVALVDAYATRRIRGREAWVALLAALVPFAAFVLAHRATQQEEGAPEREAETPLPSEKDE